MARPEAIENRRRNRQARTEAEKAKRETREEIQRKAAIRMVTRFYAGRSVHLMQLDYRYWQARRCGWDALSKDMALNDRQQPCDPHESSFWRFWVCVHWRQRAELVKLSTFKLVRH